MTQQVNPAYYPAHFATIHDRNTSAGPLNRLFILEEIVYREVAALKFVKKGGEVYAFEARESWVLNQAVNFQVEGIGLLGVFDQQIIVWSTTAASHQEVREEIAIAMIESSLPAVADRVAAEYESWLYDRGADQAADAYADDCASGYYD